MNGVVVTCTSCQRTWTLAVDASAYLLLELQSRPCPHCEACTLNCTTLSPESPDAAAEDTRPGRKTIDRQPRRIARRLSRPA